MVRSAVMQARRPRRARSRARGAMVPALLLALVPSATHARVDEAPPAVRGERGMVVSDAPIASGVGLAALESGGNAVDAAIAVAFALAVVYPEAGNLGGGGFMVAHLADGTNLALDFRETAPARATRDMFLDAAGNPTDRSLAGPLASGIPGTVRGLWDAHRRLGTLPWRDLVAPAAALADSGFLVDEGWRASVAGDSARLASSTATRAHFLPEGSVPRAGTRWRSPELAAALRRIADEGPRGFYEGATADLIVGEMERSGGIISREDLSAYRSVWRDPVVFPYRGHTVVSMPPPSSGGIALALIAKLVEPWDLGAWGAWSPERIHLVTEAMRRAFAVRNVSLGDPAFVPVSVPALLEPGRIAALRASMRADRATASQEVTAGLPPSPAPAPEGRHTTHLSIADGAGNAVALTTTLNDNFGSLVLVPGAGFLLNNEMDDFTSRPGVPNLYGLVQGASNAIEPGKRMLSSMSPTIVLDAAGEVRLVTGASGGPTIITAVFQVISNVLDHGMDIADAVNAPRFHHQHMPDEIRFEPGSLDPGLAARLGALGHRVRDAVPGSDAIPVADSIERRDGAWWGAADPRDGGTAAGW